jgi:hypothetical protein
MIKKFGEDRSLFIFSFDFNFLRQNTAKNSLVSFHDWPDIFEQDILQTYIFVANHTV